MELTLTAREAEVLRETVKGRISGMVMEIAHTDNREMREGLKSQEGVLEAILGKISVVERKIA